MEKKLKMMLKKLLSNWKEITIFILVCIVLYKYTVPQTTPTFTTNTSVSYKDANGNKYSQIITEDVEKKQLKKTIDSLNVSLKKIGKIKQLVTTTLKTDTFIKEIPIYLKDGVTHFTYQDSYLSLKGVHDSNKLDIEYHSKDTISFITHTKKPLLKKKIYYVDVVNRNPYNNINVENSLQIKEKKSILVLGPSIQYNPFQNNFNVGISLTYNLLSLKK